MMQIVSLWIVLSFMMSILALETVAATLRTRGDGDDDGGGLAGALSGMLGGGGGGGGGDGGDDDDDANMVGQKHHKKSPKSGIDEGALEKGLQTGGVDQLTMMLKMMRAGQSPADHHIKVINGEETYDFRDLDDGTTTTLAPISMTEKPTMPPVKAVEQVAGPSIKMDASGKIIGLAAAEVQVAKASKMAAAHGGKKAGKLVVWPPQAAAPQPQAMAQVGMAAGGQATQAYQTAAAVPVVGAPFAQPAAVGVPMMQPAPVGVPMMMAAPSFPMGQIPTAAGNTASGLYQGLAMLNQNMNVLMNEAAALNSKANTDNSGPLATKLDQTSQNFLSYEHKMETRVKVLEDENTVMRKQMDEQAQEIKEMEQEVSKKPGLEGQVHKVVNSELQKAKSLKNISAPIATASVPTATKLEAPKKPALRGRVPKAASSESQTAKASQNTSATVATVSTLTATKQDQRNESQKANSSQSTSATFATVSTLTAPKQDQRNEPQKVKSSQNTSATVATVSTLTATKQESTKNVSSDAENAKSFANSSAPIVGASTPKVNVSSDAEKAKSFTNSSAPIVAASTPKVPYATKPWNATFLVHVDGKEGGKTESFTIRVHPEWAPEGAKRFQDMLQAGILKDARFFRVVPGFMVQFGIPGSPKEAAKWENSTIPDDPVIKSNSRGMLSFASAGPNSRTNQIFVNYADNEFLDKQGFAPFAHVLGDGMDVVGRLQDECQEKPDQGGIQHHGNEYLKKHFPELSFIDHVDSTLTKAGISTSYLSTTKAGIATSGGQDASGQKDASEKQDAAGEQDTAAGKQDAAREQKAAAGEQNAAGEQDAAGQQDVSGDEDGSDE